MSYVLDQSDLAAYTRIRALKIAILLLEYLELARLH